MASVALENVSKVFADGTRAVDDLSLHVEEGEFMVFVGPSGCGKTTALRMVAGLESITSGTVSIDDVVVNGLDPQDRDVAMVFQNYALYPNMTVRDNLGFALRMQRVPKQEIRARVGEIAGMLGLSDLLHRKPSMLSGGQRQRVAMGRAIVRAPRVFLMDEPLSNLDAQLRVQMRGEIEALQKRVGVTTVYVTHDQVEALTMGDRISVMRGGVLQQIGTPTEVYDFPANLFVAGFIGSPPMNLAEATVVDDGRGSICLRLGQTDLTIADELNAERGLDAWLNRRVVVGVRPEDLRIATGTLSGSPRFSAVIDRVESVGANLLAHFHIDAQPSESAALVAASGGERLEDVPLTGRAGVPFCASLESRCGCVAGDVVDLEFDTRRLHLFDPNSEASLLSR